MKFDCVEKYKGFNIYRCDGTTYLIANIGKEFQTLEEAKKYIDDTKTYYFLYKIDFYEFFRIDYVKENYNEDTLEKRMEVWKYYLLEKANKEIIKIDRQYKISFEKVEYDGIEKAEALQLLSLEYHCHTDMVVSPEVREALERIKPYNLKLIVEILE